MADPRYRGNETPLFICRGSYTLEAAIVIPLAAVFLMTILFLFRVLQVQTELQQALTIAGRTGAVAQKELSLAVAEVKFRSVISKTKQLKAYVKNGNLGISTLGSKIDGDYLSLQASCRMELPINLFGLRDIHILAGSRNRIWSGQIEGVEEEAVVYYTPTGRVYHMTRSCPYLDLSIHCAEYRKINALRNKERAKYYPCRDCAVGQVVSGQVFITDYGTAYHTRLGCSGLKRTIIEVPVSEVGDRPACSKCGH